jgi:NTP pyrophosphatase (non-canonical NTP hydrolase)
MAINNEQIQHMVERFLQWRLPKNFNPDGGISFKADFNEHTAHPMKHDPIGTNLFDAEQTEAMVRHMLDGLPYSSPSEGDQWQAEQLNLFCRMVHLANEKWWIDLNTGQSLNRNVGELLMLCVSELAEAMEGHRKNLLDDKLPHRTMFEVELADAVIRIFDIAGGMGLDLGAAFVEKMQYNRIRADHKPENRRLEYGKKY